MTASATELALLGFLDEPSHGYDLLARLRTAQDEGFVWHLKQSHMYALLNKLESAGLIAATLVEQPDRPAKRLLRLTDRGRSAFAAWLREPVQHGRELRFEFLLKLYWARLHDAAADLIAAQRSESQRWMERLDAQQATPSFDALVTEFRRGQIGAMLVWLDQCEQVLEQPA